VRDRRTFLKASVAGAMTIAGFDRANALATSGLYRGLPAVPAAARALRILILGGTGFTGPFQVRYAVARGHQITVFNRGQRQADLPEGVEHLRGDRNLHETDALKGRTWDVVIDNPTTLPFWIRDAAGILRGNTNQYVMISTISVYNPAGLTRITEDSPRMEYSGGDPMAVTMADFTKDVANLYGPMKTASERETIKWFGDRATIIRPGLIVGPGDASFRFTYWPWRIRQGGEILAPGDGTDPVQIIDARDLAEWTICMVEDGNTGVYNATGPRAPLTMAQQLYGIRAAFDGNLDLSFTWVPSEFLLQHEVAPWGEMTTWIPDTDPDSVITRTDISRAIGKGLTFRPLAQTSIDAVEWVDRLPEEARARVTRAAGLAPDKEKSVLEAWKKSR
jgi:nucleoside-diphosphate-sugar epimerase